MWWKRLTRNVLPGPLRRAAQSWRLSRAVGRFSKRIVRHRYGDAELCIELPDPLAAGWYDHDWPVLPEVELLRRGRLRPGGVVFDLGAHQGIVALILARVVGPTGKVVAVEASHHNAVAAVRNRDLNRTPWIEVVEAGVAATDGVLRVSRSLNAQTAVASDYAGTIEIPAVTIDTLAIRYGRPDVIFLDVEGMEADVLRGAVATLAARPDAFVEVHTGAGLEAAGGSVAAVLGCFPAADYDLYVHAQGDLTPIGLADAPPDLLAHQFLLTALTRCRS